MQPVELPSLRSLLPQRTFLGPVANSDTLALVMPVPAEPCRTTAPVCLVPPAPINTHQPGVATSLLYSGSQFRGYQKSKGNAYEVEVSVQVKFQARNTSLKYDYNVICVCKTSFVTSATTLATYSFLLTSESVQSSLLSRSNPFIRYWKLCLNLFFFSSPACVYGRFLLVWIPEDQRSDWGKLWNQVRYIKTD